MDLARYAELFRTESREHLAEIEAALLALEQDGDTRHVTVLFRSTHTIKGMAASMGYRTVELFSHGLETLFDAVRSGNRSIDSDVIALLFEGSDALSEAVDDAVDGRPDTHSGRSAVLLQRLSNAAEVAGQSAQVPDIFGGATLPQELHGIEINDERQVAAAGLRTRVVDVRLSPDTALKGVRALIVLNRIQMLGAVRRIEPAQHSWNHDEFDGVVSITLDSPADNSAIVRAVNSAGDVMRVTVRAQQPVRSEREALRHVRIDLRRLDTLLDLVGELVITRDRLLRATDKQNVTADITRDRALTSVVHDTARLVTALQEEVLQTRMVPVGQVFDRFPRMVREVARELGKEISFATEGRDIELDRSLLDAIGDPIVHLLRNAVDHGVELPHVRREHGKPAVGRLILRAARDRAAVIVQVQDDGGGIDRDAVLARAKIDGLIEHDVATLNDDGLLRVLSRPGFSTAKSVTSVSGRGVGIDVVASRVRALGGALELVSVPGCGTTFTLRLPVTLAIVRALLVSVGNETYALPAAHVLEAIEIEDAHVETREGTVTVTVRDNVIPLMRLRQRFGIESSVVDDIGAHVVVVEANGGRHALQVDSLVGQQDVVVKPFDVVRGAETLFSGATILGDGTPALIVDLGGLA